MKAAKILISAALPIVALGCATKKAPPPQPPTVYIEEIPYGSTANVRTGETVKAYPIGRYVDPADRRMMHERHTIYRLERPSRWRLQSPDTTGDAVLLGPVAGIKAPYYKPSPLPSEISRELRKQKETTASLAKVAGDAQRQAFAEMDAARKQYAEAQELLSAQAKASAETTKKLSELERQIQEIQARPVPQRERSDSRTKDAAPRPDPSPLPGPVEIE